MNQSFRCALLAMLLAPVLANAQSAPQGWENDVRQFDSSFWDAYNKCEIKKLAQMTAADLEFYHDKGGSMMGQEKFVAAMEKNICGNPAARVRREAIADSVHVFPMLAGTTLYGAVIEGDHQFYNYHDGASEVLGGRARFTHLLLLKDGKWTASRVLSFNHLPGQNKKPLPEITLAATVLNALAGSYQAKEGMVTVKATGNHLIAVAGGASFELYPTSENNFSVLGRDIKVVFSVDKAGEGASLVARERGVVVADAKALAP